ncbi:hypothetical protein IAQ61_009852 [Plenodomus lingam]|uniref:Predicted protein n=1 Tax=Leptosphaeria maculans (strain JN3 / isolate v23.1.3 / race Av1-4-5-6-7-8) TaxID=985895 RepID=E4ZSQ7_LEPMJ|nr:predicted protein [Plenodomus lingam JN3]KAH9862436.1 hypothetical protein IAQ61_009852 [Plenodomus lingam]CBX94437.1 predicted protein [Plenodomus lingam JN3]
MDPDMSEMTVTNSNLRPDRQPLAALYSLSLVLVLLPSPVTLDLAKRPTRRFTPCSSQSAAAECCQDHSRHFSPLQVSAEDGQPHTKSGIHCVSRPTGESNDL